MSLDGRGERINTIMILTSRNKPLTFLIKILSRQYFDSRLMFRANRDFFFLFGGKST